ncbi:MAG TPA: hypothetical protein VKX16_09930 [Chloroflexota bacterium]|nr:hypothetical protein [Chloroflexota bacterium]
MTTSDYNIMLLFAGTAVLAFALTLIGADVGAPHQSVVNALCAIAVLGSMAVTVFVTARRSQ